MTSFTNQEQFEHLVDWMCNHPDIADGIPREYGKKVVGGLMEGLAEELNVLGPPHKQVYQWRKVWTDLRSFTKKKLRENLYKGRNHRLNPRERRIIKLLDLEKVIREEYTSKYSKIKPELDTQRDEQDDEELKLQDAYDANEDSLPDDDDDDNAMEHTKSEKNPMDSTTFNLVNDDENTDILADTQIDDDNENSASATITESVTTNDITKLLMQQVGIQRQQLQQQQALASAMMKFEKQLIELNEAKANNACLLEENNKLLKLMIYRSAQKGKNEPNNQTQETDSENSNIDY